MQDTHQTFERQRVNNLKDYFDKCKTPTCLIGPIINDYTKKTHQEAENKDLPNSKKNAIFANPKEESIFV
jgi:hypothetical protein